MDPYVATVSGVRRRRWVLAGTSAVILLAACVALPSLTRESPSSDSLLSKLWDEHPGECESGGGVQPC